MKKIHKPFPLFQITHQELSLFKSELISNFEALETRLESTLECLESKLEGLVSKPGSLDSKLRLSRGNEF
ncbi:hypothetical protein DASC09_031130 [Saccharomycopsis crataegensis]|uniref:Uncharacterized protein n=1 Tax=Saccharomycopsis crataegensis TaxID=43959 RepID=A0AAV5QNP8_9ASCO|nr:hypothetical protein DASC09_031130 [Saccharomycopsis crataegensis]